jgi:2-amino-4-hydroxy-6-hydroxymethyldihydropteridine diphosphokinase
MQKQNSAHRVFIGIGANLGDAKLTVIQAIQALGALPQTQLIAQSSLFLSEPIESSGDDYINAVVELKTALTPAELLEELQHLEHANGRERPYHNAPRTLDLDLLLYDAQQIDSATLTVPHPRMTGRAFVLIPLLQIDPLIQIPGKGEAHQFVSLVSNQQIRCIK